MKSLDYIYSTITAHFKTYPASLPERLWLLLGTQDHESRLEPHTRYICTHYLWVHPQQLRRCREIYGSDPSFLLDILDRIVYPLYKAGFAVPIPVVTYLAVGYTLRQVNIPRASDFTGSRVPSSGPPESLVSFGMQLNRWLLDILSYDYPPASNIEELRRTESRRLNWTALYHFLKRVLSTEEIGVTFKELRLAPGEIGLSEPLNPEITFSDRLRCRLYQEADSIEQNLDHGKAPTTLVYPDPGMEKYLSGMSRKMNAWQPKDELQLPGDNRKQALAAEQQRRAVRYYLNRASLRHHPDQIRRHSYQEQLIDLHALAGYQAFGKFFPDQQTRYLLQMLRRQMLDPSSIHKARENTVDGITRKGNFSQLLKWQFSFVEDDATQAMFYDRFLNNKLIYLRRISQRTQALSMGVLFMLDISTLAHTPIAFCSRLHSQMREICAHFLQDTYQLLWQIPKLFAEAYIIVHDQKRILWKTNLLLADGSSIQPVAEDIFLKFTPPWLALDHSSEDPATYFQFIHPALLNDSNAEREGKPSSLTEQAIRFIQSCRQARIGWARSGANPLTGGACLPVSDLLVTINAACGKPLEAPTTSLNRLAWFDAFESLTIIQQRWICRCDQKVELQELRSDQLEQTASCTLAEFQDQIPISQENQAASMRQIFVRSLLSQLLELCVEMEFRG